MSLSLLPATLSASPCDFKLTIHLWLAASASADSTCVSFTCSPCETLTFTTVCPLSSSPHISWYLLSIRWLTIFQHQIFLSEALRSSRAARCFRNHTSNTQTHTHFNSACSQFDKKCIHGTHTGARVTRRGVYVLDNTAEPTAKKKTRTHANKHILTHNLAICPVHSAVASGDNTLHWTKTHHSLHTRTSSRLSELACTFACWHLSWNPQWKLWEQSGKLITRHQDTRAAHERKYLHTRARAQKNVTAIQTMQTAPFQQRRCCRCVCTRGSYSSLKMGNSQMWAHVWAHIRFKAREPTIVQAATKATAGHPRVKTLTLIIYLLLVVTVYYSVNSLCFFHVFRKNIGETCRHAEQWGCCESLKVNVDCKLILNTVSWLYAERF